jgi:hypothetical protein
MTKEEIRKVEQYLESRRLYNPLAERLLELSYGKPDHLKKGCFERHLNYKILQKIKYGELV